MAGGSWAAQAGVASPAATSATHETPQRARARRLERATVDRAIIIISPSLHEHEPDIRRRPHPFRRDQAGRFSPCEQIDHISLTSATTKMLAQPIHAKFGGGGGPASLASVRRGSTSVTVYGKRLSDFWRLAGYGRLDTLRPLPNDAVQAVVDNADHCTLRGGGVPGLDRVGDRRVPADDLIDLGKLDRRARP